MQDLDFPPAVHVSQAGEIPADAVSDSPFNDEWRTRAASSPSAPRAGGSFPVQETAADPWQELSVPDAALQDLNLQSPPSSMQNLREPSMPVVNRDDGRGKSVLQRTVPAHSNSSKSGWEHNDPGSLRQPVSGYQQGLRSPRNIRHQDPPQENSDTQFAQRGIGQKSCDEFRSELLNTPVTDIVVDISPYPWVQPDGSTPAVANSDREQVRNWTDCNGNVLGSGAFAGLEQSYVLVRSDNGQIQRIPMMNLSDGDLAIVTRVWSLPTECSLGCTPFEGRCWAPNSVMWTASALCHKPLYFENVQLERYGHTHGPVMQPIWSTAHFFVSLVTVPYQKAIHPPNECVYALGYYRPGDCAPWLKDPVPFSLLGSVRQASFVVGTAGIIP